VSGGGEFLADDLGDDACFRPDSDCRHGGQDEVKRVGPTRASTRVGTSAREVRSWASWAASWGRTIPAAPVPATMTVCSERAVKMSAAQRLPG
jgi:hypothetical protein